MYSIYKKESWSILLYIFIFTINLIAVIYNIITITESSTNDNFGAIIFGPTRVGRALTQLLNIMITNIVIILYLINNKSYFQKPITNTSATSPSA